MPPGGAGAYAPPGGAGSYVPPGADSGYAPGGGDSGYAPGGGAGGYGSPVEGYQPPAGSGPYGVPGPYGVAPGYGDPASYGAYGAPGYGYAGGRGTNGLAIASLICSLAGLVTCISAPVGIVLGHVARRQIRQSGEDGAGLATAGMVVGYVVTALGVLVLGFYLLVAVIFATHSTST